MSEEMPSYRGWRGGDYIPGIPGATELRHVRLGITDEPVLCCIWQSSFPNKPPYGLVIHENSEVSFYLWQGSSKGAPYNDKDFHFRSRFAKWSRLNEPLYEIPYRGQGRAVPTGYDPGAGDTDPPDSGTPTWEKILSIGLPIAMLIFMFKDKIFGKKGDDDDDDDTNVDIDIDF